MGYSYIKIITLCFISQVSADEARELEEATRHQAASTRWIEERQKRLTASRFGEVMRMRPTTDGARLARDIVNPVCLTVPAVKWGKDMEIPVRRQYEIESGVEVARRGLVVDSKRLLACSPDGVLPDRLVELKGVFSRRQETVSAEIADWLQENSDGQLQLKPHTRYWYQVQGQMGIVGRERCDLVVFTDVDVQVIPVAAVPNFYETEMVPKLSAFFDRYIAPEILKIMRR